MEFYIVASKEDDCSAKNGKVPKPNQQQLTGFSQEAAISYNFASKLFFPSWFMMTCSVVFWVGSSEGASI